MLKKSLATALLSLLAPLSFASELTSEQQAFVEFAQQEYQLEADYVTDALNQANKNQQVLEAIARPWEAKPWHQYRPIFIKQTRINDGVAFFNEYATHLLRAERETGVPAEIIVAILGVETNFGKNMGKYPVLDSLYSLGFHYPPRAKFFRTELAEFLKLSQEQGFSITDIKGSYAGAMGWGQFISSSYRHYAIDFDGDGVVDILNNPVDAIGSVANYFRMHHWKKGEQIALPAQVSGDVSSLLSKNLKPKKNWQQIREAGVVIDGNIADSQKATLVELEQTDNNEYWVGLQNFYVITRYNHSPLYAMAVFQLSEEIKAKLI